jgi:hypothetical protein
MSIEPLFTLRQLAARTGLSIYFLRDLAESGDIEVIRKGAQGRIHIRESAWLAWQESHKHAPTSKVTPMPLNPPKQAPVRPKPFNVDDLLPPGFEKPFPRSA